jgi:hypothetical protein
MELSPISDEQQIIIDFVKTGVNINIDAVAGSGKTTTSLYIAKYNSDKRILLLTYNAKLKLETKEKAKFLNLSNIEIHSYHAFCVKYFSKKGFNDAGILDFLKHKNNSKFNNEYNYDIVIVDEAQDMNPLYFELTNYILKNLISYQLIVMGDRKQTIYSFNKADNRYLIYAPQIYKGIWQNAKLSTSYRITNSMANFLNECCYGALPIKACKNGEKVRYIICDTYGQKPLLLVLQYLEMGYTFSDIFILSPSVRSERSPVRNLANQLTTNDIPIYVPTSDEEHLDEDILKGKIVFSSFHQVKGLERKVVFVFNFDSGYFEYYDKNGQKDQIPNTLYVAATRSKEHLILLHGQDKQYCDFINVHKLPFITSYEISSKFHKKMLINANNKIEEKPFKPIHIGATELIKFIPVEIIDTCKELITIEKIDLPKEKNIKIPVKSKQDDLYESVSEITGVAIPTYYELLTTNKITIHEHIENNIILKMNSKVIRVENKCLIVESDDEQFDDNTSQNMDVIELNPYYKEILTSENTETLLKLTTNWVAQKTGYNFKKSQIKKYDWLSKETLINCINRLESVLINGSNRKFEVPFEISYNEFIIRGFVDLIENNNKIWELKVVKQLETEHFIQLSIYLWLYYKINKKIEPGFIYNIITNEQYKITSSIVNLEKIVSILCHHKKNGIIKKSYEDFIQQCTLIYNKVYS